LNHIKDEFKATDLALPAIFREINTDLRRYSMEIKSIHLTNSNNDRVTYHGLVNTEEDSVAKDHGTPFNIYELKYFVQITNKLLESNYLSTADIVNFRDQERIKREQAHNFIGKLENLGYLRRNDANYLILGVKAHLELRSYLESVILEAADLEALEEAERKEKTAQLKALIDELPQIIVY
jgi:hypothetical protein